LCFGINALCSSEKLQKSVKLCIGIMGRYQLCP
jgi:hypothetical protein